jgi:pyruvate dehydrogenase E2 component (dihydrolipoamide acetyltransferase)
MSRLGCIIKVNYHEIKLFWSQAPGAGMPVNITMPQLGQTTDQVKLVKWLVEVGDAVKRGDPICHVETDKVAMDVESFHGGTVLALVADEDSTVKVGDTIAVIGEQGEDAPGGAPEPAAADRVTARSETSIRATPLVKNLALKRGIDLSRVRGSGPGGLITRKDLDEEAASGGGAVAQPPGVGPEGRGEERPHRLTPHQVKVGESMARNKREVPHYYLKSLCRVDRLLRMRERLALPDGTRPAVDAFVVHAAARALREHPKVNGFMRGGRLFLSDRVHVAVAVAAGEELYAPVIRDADTREVGGIDRELRLLAARARAGAVEPGDLSGATFTVTNLGMLGVDEFYAVITPPQVGVLAVGRLHRTLDVDEDGGMRVRAVCALTGSFDHRAVNGAEAARFLETVKRYLQEDQP